jgi:hypothetical protein
MYYKENMDIFVYVNVKGRIIEAIPVKVEEGRTKSYYMGDHLRAMFLTRVNAEEKRGDYYERYMPLSEGEIRSNTLWLSERNKDKARDLFYKDLMKRYKIAERKFNLILDEKEQFEREES